MGDLISFEGKRSWIQIKRFFTGIGEQASSIASEYQSLMLNDPRRAIGELNSFLDRVRNINNGRGWESFCGGPNDDVTVPLLNIVGSLYPHLDRPSKTEGLRQCLGYLDRLNYFYSQNNVVRIDEPLLVRDIVISSRGLYWCGYEKYLKILDQNGSWSDFYPHIQQADSEFWLALAVTRPKHASLEVRTRFYKMFPSLMDRTLDAISGITYEESSRCHEKEGKTLEEDVNASLEMYDVNLHDRMRQKMSEKSWINLENR